MSTKILFILHLPPPVHGASMMGKYIHDSKVVNDIFDCYYINLATAKNLADIGKIGIRKLKQFQLLLHTIRKEVRRLKPQLVYVTANAYGGAFYKDFIVVEMLKGMGAKVVVHYHNKGIILRQNKVLDNYLYKKFFKGLKVILLAKALYEDVRKYVRREDVMICPNGISSEVFKEEPKEKHPQVIPHLLFLSNLLEDKGVLVLLDACQILKAEGYSFVCDFVGGETSEMDNACFEKEIRGRDLTNVVKFHGCKIGSEKMQYWANANIFVFPTFYHKECFPLVLLEAMEQGIVCVSTNEGGISDIIENDRTGFIVEKRNAKALAERIAYLIDHRDICKRMGIAGKEKFEREFTLSRFENNMVNVLNKCLE